MSDDKTRTPALDLAGIRARLESAKGPLYWRSLDELAGTEEFREFLHHEFPRLSAGWSDTIDRRGVLKLLGASLALAGLSACTRAPQDKIVPYVRTPEEFVSGKPLYYATSLPLSGFGMGLLVESHLGRPTKIEGNPEHPASLGSTDVFAQASILSLYDPDRSQVVVQNGRLSSWVSFVAAVNVMREALAASKGAGLRILTGSVSSPTLISQIQALLAEFPAAKWYAWEPLASAAPKEGSRRAFGQEVDAVYSIEEADVILSLDADFLNCGPGRVRYAREWASRRGADGAPMNRLFVVESSPSITGAAADGRAHLLPAEVEAYGRAVAAALGLAVAAGPVAIDGPIAESARIVANHLSASRGKSLVIAGESQPASVHALAHALNAALGNVGATLYYTDPVLHSPAGSGTIAELSREMKSGAVEVLAILGCNPLYDAPADLDFAAALRNVKTAIHVGLYLDETARFCNWHIPATHYLESWGDARAFDGTAGIIQPLIAPMYDGKSAHEIVATLSGKSGMSGYTLVREYWQQVLPGPEFEASWQHAVHDGVVAGSAFAARQVSLNPAWDVPPAPAAPATGIEILFRPDPTVLDGSFANNGWLQELPKPLTKLTWDNAALVAPATAEKLGLQPRDVVEISSGGRKISAPVWILPGHPRDSVTLNLGYGRTHAGKVGSGLGFSAYALRTSDAPWSASGADIRKTGGRAELATTQDHHGLEGRNIYRWGTSALFREDPEFARKLGEAPPRELTLYPEFKYEGHAWGMVVNLSACIGCNACVVACQSENNIPIVGKSEVANGREMHWIRIDRYYEGNLDGPLTHFQPVMCQHCENAPCEVVCPVNATNHSAEGLNQMVYNRCVGTRYCSNNCPYKVRRFNFFQYSDYETPSLVGMRNPDVTVRGRGVMEKCTYCVQRINAAKIGAEKEDRPLRDGEIVTACQSACPTRAIVFGDLNDPNSRVSQAKASPLAYGMLADLNTRPRTSYSAKLVHIDTSARSGSISEGKGE